MQVVDYSNAYLSSSFDLANNGPPSENLNTSKPLVFKPFNIIFRFAFNVCMALYLFGDLAIYGKPSFRKKEKKNSEKKNS